MEIGFVTIDCRSAPTLIEFWSKALGYDVNEGVYVTIRDPEGRRPSLYFQEVPDPTPGKLRMHLDLLSEDVGADLSRLVDLGATRVRDMTENNLRWTVMEDPEGNVFCVFDVSEGEVEQPTV